MNDYKNNVSGVTMVELLLAISIITILFTILAVVLDPVGLKAKGRDTRRISDISTLERAISEYQIDNNAYPDTANNVRTSDTLPTGSSGPVENAAGGWIAQDLSDYFTKLPVDPINNSTYHYTYVHNTYSYEINAVLEYSNEYALNSSDGGDDDSLYEVGTNLTIL